MSKKNVLKKLFAKKKISNDLVKNFSKKLDNLYSNYKKNREKEKIKNEKKKRLDEKKAEIRQKKQ